jgi:uncharacterized protein YwqG
MAMDPALELAATAVLVVAALSVGRSAIRRHRRNRAIREDVRQFREDLERSNPPGPPLTEEEVGAFDHAVTVLALPAVELRPVPGEPVAAAGSRLGGPAWLPAGEEWPVGRGGRPQEFVAQIDFADLPTTPDFPASGLLQVFVGRDDLFGCDFEDPSASDFTLAWRETVAGEGRLVPPPPLDADRDCSPWQDDSVRETGIALRGTSVVQQAPWGDWRVDALWEGWLNRPNFPALEQALDERPDTPGQCHHVGGHAVFTQQDFRSAERYGDYDRCLLRLTSDDYLMWGDVGEAVFLLPADDLRRRDWSRVAYSWDCS